MNGIQVLSDVVTYRAEEQQDAPRHSDLSLLAIWVSVTEGTWGGMSTRSSEATIQAAGNFADNWDPEHPPVMTNVQLWCSEQSGNWGTGDDEVELIMGATCTTVSGTPDDPRLIFVCRVELKVPSAKNVIVSFDIGVGPDCYLQSSAGRFEYGTAEILPGTGGTMQLVYRTWDHG
jgi:hypothetical protein